MEPVLPPANRRFLIGVRELVEFTARAGDLDLRFGAAPTAQEGLAGHARVAARRRSDYESEVVLSADEGLLTVRGRADGFDKHLQRLEEIKTYRGRFESIKPNQRSLHWAQAQVYGHLLCQARGLTRIELALVYLNLEDERETVLLRWATAAELEQFHRRLCGLFVSWAQQELAHQARRSQALQTLSFPLAPLRPGQRDLAEAVWRCLRKGRSLMVQAPTGIGKTLGTLFPSLKAMAAPPSSPKALDKLFYLAAKGSGRDLALRALSSLSAARGPQPLRVLELMAREKACEHPDKACYGQSCLLARGFYDKLPRARAAAVQAGWLDATSLRQIALEHELCPYHLGRDLINWADVVVGDYNHWFDTHGVLYAISLARSWQVAVLVDEAHNLIERGRQMYSVTLSESTLKLARGVAPPDLKRPLSRLQRHWRELRTNTADYRVLDELPLPLRLALHNASARIAAWQAQHPELAPGPLHQFGFDLMRFLHYADQASLHSLIDVSVGHPGTRQASACLSVRNVLPAPFLKERWNAARASVLFSATLAPTHHYRHMLGWPDDGLELDLPVPFHSEQLQVRVAAKVSTRWADRPQSLPALVHIMAAQWRSRPGKYLAFFSSFDYLGQVSAALQTHYPQVPQWRQETRMHEDRQQAFIERFRSGAAGIGFAVLGGSFAEGIDLPGEQLIGAFIATLGLPQINPVQEELRKRTHQLLGQGYEHTYLYPGLRKVVQAAGRVIRSPSDRGVVWLMDERYAQARVRALLPNWWPVELIADPGGLEGAQGAQLPQEAFPDR